MRIEDMLLSRHMGSCGQSCGSQGMPEAVNRNSMTLEAWSSLMCLEEMQFDWTYRNNYKLAAHDVALLF